MPIDMNLANENRVTGAVTAYLSGRQNIDWAMSQIQGINIKPERLHELIETTIEALASLDVMKDKPVTAMGNELLTRLKLH